MKHFSKLKKKLRSSDSANQDLPQRASGPAAASTSQIASPSCHQSTGFSLKVPIVSSPAIVSPSTSIIEQASVSSLSAEPENATPSVPDRLWNKAYSILEEKEPDIVQNYQKILQMVQNEWDDSTAPEELQNLEHCKGAKSREMWRLVYCGLEKSKRQAKYKENLSTAIETIENIKGVVDKAVKYSTEAGIAWAGVCLGLEILSNPMKEPGLNRKGIAYVLSRMEWYWNLADLVLLQENSSGSSVALRTNLETQIIDFYKKLLLFQMRSACLYYRNWASVILRDAVKLDDWSGELSTIKDAERLILKDIEQYDHQDIKLKLGSIESSSLEQAESLESVCKILREEARLKEKNAQDDKDKDCLAALLITDPRMDKKRIQSQKGDPLKESYEWILKTSAYKTFIDDPSSRVLWINGPPGKGKTMLLCGIIDELQKGLRPISFFLCQANVKEEDLSSDIAVMRGLIYVLLEHQPSLISAIRPSYDKQKDRLFSSINSSELLGDILATMLQDPSLRDTILLVDALDECTINRSKLTNLIVELSKSCNTKWIVSSRDWPEIHQELADATGLISLDLKQEHELVSQAVKSYISKKVDHLAKTKWKNDLELKQQVFDYMQSHADDTFLWVALVGERLANSGIRKRLVMEELVKFPKSLTALYQAMMDRITNSSEADRLKQILALVCVVYRPITSAEISVLVEPMAGYDDDDVRDAISSCGSFLTLQDGEIFFVHQSAKEFLLDQGHEILYPRGRDYQHAHIFTRCIDAMENILRQDIYELGSPGACNPVEIPSPDPLASVKYSCVYWAQHFCQSNPVKEPCHPNLNTVLHFLQVKFTSWLEALSLTKELSSAITSMMALETTVADVQMQELTAFIRDARRFIGHHKPAIEIAALQVYCSALIFSPKNSVIRQRFSYQMPDWIAVKPEMNDDLEAHMQTIHIGHELDHACYSPDGRYLVLSFRGTSFLFETVSGDMLHEEKNHGYLVSSRPIYSPDGLLVCSLIRHGIAILHAHTLRLIRKLEVMSDQCFFLPESNNIVFMFDRDVTVVNWKTGDIVSRLSQIKDRYSEIALLSASCVVAVSPDMTKVKIWDLETGDCKHTVDWIGKEIESVACSFDGHRIAATSKFDIRLWGFNDTQGWAHKHDLRHPYLVSCLTFAADSRMLISGSHDNYIRIWDETGVCIKLLKGHSQYITCLSVCQIRNHLASGGYDGAVRLWDLSEILSEQLKQKRSSSVQTCDYSLQASEQTCSSDKDLHINSLLFSPTGRILASISDGQTHIWDAATDICTDLLFSGGASEPDTVSFTPDDRLVAMRDVDGKLGVWDTKYRTQIHFSDLGDSKLVAISADGRYVSSLSLFDAYGEKVLRVWDLIKYAQTEQHITSEPLPLEPGAQALSFIYSEDWKVLATSPPLKLHVLHRKPGYWVDEQLPDDSGMHNWEIILALFPDGKGLLTYKIKPRSFSIRELTSPYAVKELGSLQANAPPYNTPQLEEPARIVVTRYGLLGVGEPSDFKGTARIGWGLSVEMDWIMRGNERMLWIPAEYRRMALDVNASRVAFVCSSGQIKFIRLQ